MVRTCEEAVTKTKIAIVEQTEAQYPPSDPIPIVTSKLLHDLFTDDQLLLTDEEASLISVDALSCVWDTPEEDKAWAGM